jgi:hypothetical protein
MHLDILTIGFVICGLMLLFGWIFLGISLYQDFSVSFGSFVTQPTGFVIL